MRNFNFCHKTDILPVTLVWVLWIYSYYAYVYEMCIRSVNSNNTYFWYIVTYHVLLMMGICMYFVVACHRGYGVPELFKMTPKLVETLQSLKNDDEAIFYELVDFCKSRELVIYTREIHNHGLRYCMMCEVVKPDRTHHCNICQRCIVKMYHHCAWVNNCIGFTNFKSFMMMLLYCALYCTFYFATTLKYTIKVFTGLEHKRQATIVVGNLIAVITGGFLFTLLFFHLKLISNNETTLEVMYKPTFAEERCHYDGGWRLNCQDHCTKNPLKWCIPIDTMRGNGTTFEVYRS